MNKLRIVLLILILPLSSVWGQEETLFGGGEFHSSGFGGPVLKVGSFNGETAVLAGGRGAWLINHVFAIGGGGFGVATDHSLDSASELRMGYGGLILEVILGWDKLVHFTGDVLIGGGALTFDNPGDDRRDSDDDDFDEDVFFVLEPAVNVEVNITTFFRIGVGASYRWTSGVENVYGIEQADVDGLSANLTLKFGSF